MHTGFKSDLLYKTVFMFALVYQANVCGLHMEGLGLQANKNPVILHLVFVSSYFQWFMPTL